MIRIAASLALLVSASEFGLAAEQGPLLKGEPGMGGWKLDKPGVRRLFSPQDLPPVNRRATLITFWRLPA